MAGFIEMKAALDEGACVCMTADISNLAARRAGLGIVTLARASGRPIVPVAYATSRRIDVKSWDRVDDQPALQPRRAAPSASWSQVPDDADDALLEAKRHAGRDQRSTRRPRAPTRIVDRRQAERRNGRPSRQRAARGLSAGRAARIDADPAARPVAARVEAGKEDPSPHRRALRPASAATAGRALVWVHAASVGETNAVLPLDPASSVGAGLAVVFTTVTVTSARIAAERPAGGRHPPVRADRLQAAGSRRFLGHWRPDLALFVESELWPQTIIEPRATRGIPLVARQCAAVGASFSGWKRSGRSSRALFAQGRRSASRRARRTASAIATLGVPKVVGHRQPQVRRAAARWRRRTALAAFKAAIGDRPVWVAASTHRRRGGDRRRARTASSRRASRASLTVIVPRHPERGPDDRGARSRRAASRSRGGARRAALARDRDLCRRHARRTRAVLPRRAGRLHRRLAGRRMAGRTRSSRSASALPSCTARMSTISPTSTPRSTRCRSATRPVDRCR